MGFTVLGALAAGLVATIVMSAMMKMTTAAGMTQMPAMHPRMGAVPAPAGVGAVSQDAHDADDVHLSAPGFFGVRWGAMTPLGLVVGHVVYGLVAAVVYGTFA